MKQDFFNKTDYVIFILGIIFVSFGITVPVEIILLISKKINYFFENYNKTFNTSFYN